MEENQINNLSAEQAGPNAEGQESAPVAQTEAAEATTATSNAPAAQNVENNVKIEEPVQETPAAHDDFDWSIDKRNVASYTRKKKRSTTRCTKTLSYNRTMVK